MLKGNYARLYLRINASGYVWQDLTQGHGLSDWETVNPDSFRELPPRDGAAFVERTGVREGTTTLTCDSDSITDVLFWGGNGRELEVRSDPEGTSTGKPRLSFNALVEASWTAEDRGVCRWSVTLHHDGGITASTL